jgi:hypothetical protein
VTNLPEQLLNTIKAKTPNEISIKNKQATYNAACLFCVTENMS